MRVRMRVRTWRDAPPPPGERLFSFRDDVTPCVRISKTENSMCRRRPQFFVGKISPGDLNELNGRVYAHIYSYIYRLRRTVIVA